MGLSKYSQEVIKFLETVPNKEGIQISSHFASLHNIVSKIYNEINLDKVDIERNFNYIDNKKISQQE